MLLLHLGLLCVGLPWPMGSLPIPHGAARTECRGRFFWIWLDQAFAGRSGWRYGVYTDSGQNIEVTPQLASQCGFTAGSDLRGNPQIRVSFLACSVHNTFDQEFSLQLWVEVTGPTGPGIPYDVAISCPLGAPWSPREIVCEENYMEVSVRRAVPGIASEALNEDWIAAWPVAQGALNQVWQVVFHFRNGSLLSMPATLAHSLGYGVNATATRILFRAPYGTTQSERATVEGLDVEVARATVFYKQAWMMLMVDTAVACPVSSPVVSATTLSWETPRILPSLVLWPEQYQDERVQMGLDGRLIDAATVTRNGYTLLTDARLVRIVVPIGAPGGLMQSALEGKRYGARYSIHLLLDRHWQGDASDRTRHRSYRPIHTPFSHRPPLIIDDSVAAEGYFKVRLGHFLPDVELVSVSVGGRPLSHPQAQDCGFDPHEEPNPNGTKAFVLRVPFADPLVQQQYLHGPLRRYTLHLNYTLRLVPTGQTFAQPGLVTCDVPDVVPPTFQGSCEAGALTLVMTRGTLDRFWVPYIGEQPLSQQAAPLSYQVSDDGHHFHLAVPLLAPGLAYESISLHWLAARLEFSLRDNKTLAVLASFSIVCTFPTGQLLVCLPNGTMVATVRSLDTRPALDPRRTHLRDPSCGPVASDSSQALFSFSLASCGTTRQFEGDSLVYENEVTFVPEGVPAIFPIITRDSWYRLTLRCRYPLTETLWIWARHQLQEDVASRPRQSVG